MFFTFFLNDEFTAVAAYNTNVTSHCTCTSRLIANTRYFIIKKGPQDYKEGPTEYTENTEGKRIFYFFYYIFFLFILCILCVLWALYGLLSFRRKKC